MLFNSKQNVTKKITLHYIFSNKEKFFIMVHVHKKGGKTNWRKGGSKEEMK